MANAVKIVEIGEADSFKGDDDEKVAKRSVLVTFDKPVRVMLYGANVERFNDLKLTEGEKASYFFRKAPSITII